ncbi:uncharacterized protein LOC105196570 [Solenopsis invicta]|uniref:uncharacterized protein LOC105196570 n=1 Tax=Solenopsis invicta TaxID=13686 RepID=UPI000E33DA60|nr:uncharacterized protein LOC105196570 [Solenopsis invicta]XP_039306115.1 uncharacterized protein LOC105196570 [Solenopsis invicta]
MAVRGTLISLNEIIQRAIGINDIEQMPGVQNLNRRSDPQEEAFLYGTLNHPSLSESSWSQIDRSPLHERRCRQQRRRRRRWKISNCFRCTSAVRDEAHNSQIASPSEKSPGLESNALLVTHLPLLFFDNGLVTTRK